VGVRFVAGGVVGLWGYYWGRCEHFRPNLFVTRVL